MRSAERGAFAIDEEALPQTRTTSRLSRSEGAHGSNVVHCGPSLCQTLSTGDWEQHVTDATFARGTLTGNEMKQQISIAYIRAVAAAAGMQISRLDVDYDGIDLTLRSFVKYPKIKGSQIDVQLKCTSQLSKIKDDHVEYSLRRGVYEDFNDPNRYQQGMLAVLVVPENIESWLHQDEERLLARGCMYFSLGQTWDAIADDQDSKLVKCPRSNVLDVASLLRLMHEASEFRAGVFQ